MPDAQTLDKYQKMFFAMPNKNLPFTHESMPILDNPPGNADWCCNGPSADWVKTAFNLALLADGAMYCGDYTAGIWLFEASRRLASDHVCNHGFRTAPNSG